MAKFCAECGSPLTPKQRLSDTMKMANDYADTQESPTNTFIGCFAIALIGVAITYFFHVKWAWVVGVALAGLGLLGRVMQRNDTKAMEDGKRAADLIAEYKKRGYDI